MKLDLGREKGATRDGFGEALLELAGKNKDVMALTANLGGSTRILKFRDKFPSRFIDVGVAEQNLVTVGSGLAAMGKIPFVTSFAVFSPGRCIEQIRTTIAYNNRNVKIIASHTGITVGEDGATHQALEDIAMLRAIPNMTVIVPADYEQTKKATRAIAKQKGPTYMRFARSGSAQYTTRGTPFEIGKAQVLKDGKDIAIIGAGPFLEECFKAALKLQEQKIDAMVINLHTIKPIDKKTIVNAARKTRAIVTVEEHQVHGGIGSAVAEVISQEYPVPIKMIGIQDSFGESGNPSYLMKKFNCTASDIVKAAKSVIKKKKR